MNCNITIPQIKIFPIASFTRIFNFLLLSFFVAGLCACENRIKNSSQILARVNGEEITVLQLNDELRNSEIQPDQQSILNKQLLESLVNRQLVIDEAIRNKINRTTEVVQAIERAKAQIIEKAYLDSITSKIALPSAAEISNYYHKHPHYFADRKQFDLHQLIIPTKDVSSELKLVFNTANSIDAVATWLDKHKIKYSRDQILRTTADLPDQIINKILSLHTGQMFIVQVGDNSLLNYISDIKDKPVTEEIAAPEIKNYLIRARKKDLLDNEIAHLRSIAKIEYLNIPESATQ